MATTKTPKFPQFNAFACVGDSITWKKDGFDIRATLRADTDTHVNDQECYSVKHVKAWLNDEWFFVGVVLSVSFNGVALSDHAASLWGVDCNFPKKGANRYLSEVAQELENEAIECGRTEVTRILEALKG